MSNDQKIPMIGYAMLGLVAIAGVAFVARASRSEVGFCREVLKGLAEGKPSVKGRIAWERLRALDVDVGATYQALPNEEERAKYRQAFVLSFSQGFRQQGGAVKAFQRWRVHERRGTQVVVAADYVSKQKTLLMGIPASGPKKLETIQWQ